MTEFYKFKNILHIEFNALQAQIQFILKNFDKSLILNIISEQHLALKIRIQEFQNAQNNLLSIFVIKDKFNKLKSKIQTISVSAIKSEEFNVIKRKIIFMIMQYIF